MQLGTFKCVRCEYKFVEDGIETIQSYEELQGLYGKRVLPDKPILDLIDGEYVFICPECYYYLNVIDDY